LSEIEAEACPLKSHATPVTDVGDRTLHR
jgi:hypothetical protein